MILIEIISFKNILTLIDLATVKTNMKDVHAFLFIISHFVYLVIYVYNGWV